MPKTLTLADAIAFKEARQLLPPFQFHAVQQSPNIKKWWEVVYKNGDDFTIIKIFDSQKKAEKLANLLNEDLSKVRA